MLNTNWGDYGNPCSLELSMFGIFAGAQMSWDFENLLDDEFKKAINKLLYNNDYGFEYVYKTDRIHAKANYWQLVRYYSNCIFPDREIRWTKYPSVEDVQEAAVTLITRYNNILVFIYYMKRMITVIYCTSNWVTASHTQLK